MIGPGKNLPIRNRREVEEPTTEKEEKATTDDDDEEEEEETTRFILKGVTRPADYESRRMTAQP